MSPVVVAFEFDASTMTRGINDDHLRFAFLADSLRERTDGFVAGRLSSRAPCSSIVGCSAT